MAPNAIQEYGGSFETASVQFKEERKERLTMRSLKENIQGSGLIEGWRLLVRLW